MDPGLLVERVAVDAALLVLGRLPVRLERPAEVAGAVGLVGPLEVVLAERHPRVRHVARLRVALDERAVRLERLGIVPVPLGEVLAEEVEHLVEARVLRVLRDDRLVERDRLVLVLARLVVEVRLLRLEPLASRAGLPFPSAMSWSSRRFASKKKYCDSSQSSSARRKYHCGVSASRAAAELDELVEAGDLLAALVGDVDLDGLAEGLEVERRAARRLGGFGLAASSVPPSDASGATERFWPRSASFGGAGDRRHPPWTARRAPAAAAPRARGTGHCDAPPGQAATGPRRRAAGRRSLQPLVSVYE